MILLFVLAALVAAGCGEYGKRYSGSEEKQKVASEDTPITDEAFDEAVRKRDGCTELEEFDSEGSTHVESSEKVTYKHNPPMSGSHWNDPSVDAPAEWGLYDKQLRDEQTVHNLEHGHILIEYKGLSEKDKQLLYDTARINPYHLLVQPRDKNPKKGVYYMAWTAQIHCERPSAAALQYMIEQKRDQGPELYMDDPGGKDV